MALLKNLTNSKVKMYLIDEEDDDQRKLNAKDRDKKEREYFEQQKKQREEARKLAMERAQKLKAEKEAKEKAEAEAKAKAKSAQKKAKSQVAKTAEQHDAEEKAYYESGSTVTPIKSMHQAGKTGVAQSTDTDTGEYKATNVPTSSDYAKEIAWREEQEGKTKELADWKNDFLLNRAIAKADGGYIQDQNILEDIPYGTKGTGAGSSCGSISAYNDLVKMGIKKNFKDVYNYFSENGTLMGGALGTNPMKIQEYLDSLPGVDSQIHFDKNEIGKHDSHILVYFGATAPKYEGDEPNVEAHYQHFDVNEDGRIQLTNPDETYDSVDEYLNKVFANGIGLSFLITTDKLPESHKPKKIPLPY